MNIITIHKPIVPEVASEMASGMMQSIALPLESIVDFKSDVFDSAAGLYRRFRPQDALKTTSEWENNHLWIGLNPM